MRYKITCDVINSENEMCKAETLVGISLLQDYSYNDQFIEIYTYVEKHFPNSSFLLGDQLVYHTYRALGHDHKISNSFAENGRKEWENRLLQFNFTPTNGKVKPWKTYSQDELFEDVLNFVKKLYDDNQKFKEAVEISIAYAFRGYVSKHGNKINHKNFSALDAINHCKNFLFEEIAVLLLISRKYAQNEIMYFLYPMNRQSKTPMRYVFASFEIALDNYYANKMKFLFLKIDKNKDSKKVISDQELTHQLHSSTNEVNILDKLHKDFNMYIDRLKKNTGN